MACLLFMTVFYMAFSILRAFGDAKTPLYFMIVSSVINIVLDIVFITVFNMGAALATTISQIVACIACMIYAFKTNEFFQLSLHHKAWDAKLVGQCARLD